MPTDSCGGRCEVRIGILFGHSVRAKSDRRSRRVLARDCLANEGVERVPRLTVAAAMRLLEDNARRIAAAAATIPAERLSGVRMVGDWTATDVLAHLRSCADACADVIPRILESDRPTLNVIGPRVLIETTNYRSLEFGTSLRAFMRQRERLLELLGELPRSQWLRSAVIVDCARRRERTVTEYTDWLSRHERRHVEQFERFARRTSRLPSPVRSGRTTARQRSRGA